MPYGYTKAAFTKSCALTAVVVAGFALPFWLFLRWRKQGKYTVKTGIVTWKKPVVYVVSSAEEWEHCYPCLLQELQNGMMLGLDCEWVMKQPVALLQLSSWSHYCVLVRLHRMGCGGMPESLRKLLADKRIVKVGVAVNDDAKKLMRDWSLQVNGCVDLRHLMPRVRDIFQCRRLGLQGLAKTVLDVDMIKESRVRCSNWEASRLSAAQIDYAAKDAIVAVDIFVLLVLGKLTGLHPRLDVTRASGVSRQQFLVASRSLVQGLVDLGYRTTGSVFSDLPERSQASVPHQTRASQTKGAAFSTRRRPLWDNCQLLAPDGQPLCTCDSSKAAWYMARGLGDKVSDSPLVVRLRFEPAGRPRSARNYYLQAKDNMCVVCGETENYARKFIVPRDYRKYFPAVLKDHTSHDVLLMCPPCHRRSSDHDGALRGQLALECRAPLNSHDNSAILVDHDLQQVKSAGRALKLSRDKIPAGRLRQLEKVLYDYYGIPDISDDVIEAAVNIDVKQDNRRYVPHALRVVERMAAQGHLLQFQARWRRHFVLTMQPRHLPAFWTVDYVPENWQDPPAADGGRAEDGGGPADDGGGPADDAGGPGETGSGGADAGWRAEAGGWLKEDRSRRTGLEAAAAPPVAGSEEDAGGIAQDPSRLIPPGRVPLGKGGEGGGGADRSSSSQAAADSLPAAHPTGPEVWKGPDHFRYLGGGRDRVDFVIVGDVGSDAGDGHDDDDDPRGRCGPAGRREGGGSEGDSEEESGVGDADGEGQDSEHDSDEDFIQFSQGGEDFVRDKTRAEMTTPRT